MTNYRAYFNALYHGNNPEYETIKSLTHADYDAVLTSNVEKKTENMTCHMSTPYSMNRLFTGSFK